MPSNYRVMMSRRDCPALITDALSELRSGAKQQRSDFILFNIDRRRGGSVNEKVLFEHRMQKD
jgi:hypothetical protein